jgi:hypothetical protein
MSPHKRLLGDDDWLAGHATCTWHHHNGGGAAGVGSDSLCLKRLDGVQLLAEQARVAAAHRTIVTRMTHAIVACTAR